LLASSIILNIILGTVIICTMISLSCLILIS